MRQFTITEGEGLGGLCLLSHEIMVYFLLYHVLYGLSK